MPGRFSRRAEQNIGRIAPPEDAAPYRPSMIFPEWATGSFSHYQAQISHYQA